MALKFFYDAENSTTLSGTDYSSGDTTGANTATTFAAGSAKTGSYGLSSAASTQTSLIYDASSIWPSAATPANSAGAMAFWMQSTTGSMNNGSAFGMRCTGASSADRIGFQGLTGAGVSLIVATATGPASTLCSTTAVTMSAATWYFVVGRWDIPTGKLGIAVYTDAGGSTLAEVETPVEVTGVALSTTYLPSTAFENLVLALHSSAETNPLYTDHFLVSDNYDAPLQNNAFITDYANYSESTIKAFQYRARANPLLRM